MISARTARIAMSSALLALALPFVISAGSAGAAAKASSTAKGTPLVLGSIQEETSSAATGSSTEGADSLNAWVKWTNAHGGIAGHPVKMTILDDKGDPAVGLADAKTLIQSDHVIAILNQTASVTDGTWAPYVLQEKIPVIGGLQIDALYFTNPMFYPVGGTVIANIWGQMKSAAVQGVKKIGVVLCTEAPACAQAQPLFKSEAESVGMTVVYDALASSTQPSYTAECLAAKQAGVQAMAAYVNNVVFARDCSRQGFKPKWISADGGPGVTTIQAAPALGNAVGSDVHWICAGPQTAQTAPFYEAMKKYASQWLKGGKDYASSADSDCSSWDAGAAFQQAILNADIASSATATNLDVIRGLSMFKDTKLGGYSPPMTYGDGTTPNPQAKCVYLYKWKGTTEIPVPGPSKYSCQP
jgi:branched-chain amino acid transport system substrate-binding protein